MKYLSTRGHSPEVSFSEALQNGLAPDGGLYIPHDFPKFDIADFDGLHTVPEIGAKLLAPFLTDDPLADQLEDICKSALNFPVPTKFLSSDTAVLELFHGPTSAFKDVGARFLSECASRLIKPNDPVTTVMVAASGDTGGAVAGAFAGKPGIEVLILFPKGKISARQEKQLTCWGGNVRAFSVHGHFDDCQKIVKEALADPWWKSNKRLLSANSINIGRLLPQMVYYAKASLVYFRRTGRRANFIVPSGNLGNSVAALWAKKVGLPIGKVVLATNANRAISDYFASGKWNPQNTISTLANAMDVGNPSNMERVFHLYANLEQLKQDVATLSVSDQQIEATIRGGQSRWGEIWCPHTATAVFTREQITSGDWIIVATAHPAKFESIVEPLIGATVPIPKELQALLNRPSQCTEIEPQLSALKNHI